MTMSEIEASADVTSISARERNIRRMVNVEYKNIFFFYTSNTPKNIFPRIIFFSPASRALLTNVVFIHDEKMKRAINQTSKNCL